MAAPAKERSEREGPGLRRTTRDTASAVAAEQRAAVLALIDDLAALAADLWFSGQLDAFPPEEDAADEDE